MYRICKFCGKGFEGKTSKDKYCSVICRQKKARQNEAERRKANGIKSKAVHEKRTCLYCGKGFISSRKDQIYCSSSCRALASKANRDKESS